MTPDQTPTKPIVMTMPDYRARLAAYRAVSTSEMGSLEGPVTTWDATCVVIDAYLQALQEQADEKIEKEWRAPRVSVYDSPSGEFVAEDRWRELARGEAEVGCSDPKCDCNRGL